MDKLLHPMLSSWWRHQMESFYALSAPCAGNSPVTGVFPRQIASDAELWCFLWSAHEKTQLSKQLRRRWFETPWRSLWRHCNELWVLLRVPAPFAKILQPTRKNVHTVIELVEFDIGTWHLSATVKKTFLISKINWLLVNLLSTTVLLRPEWGGMGELSWYLSKRYIITEI